jgi:hypothetical protein
MYHSCNLYSIILSFISAMALAVAELEWLMTLQFFSDPAHAACIGGSPWDCSGCN